MNNNLSIISSYPISGTYSHTHSALASFTSNLVDGIRRNFPDLDITIYADRGELKQNILDAHISRLKIYRVWKRNSITSLLDLLRNLLLGSNKDLLFQYEWTLFGDSLIYNVFLLLLLTLLKLSGKHCYVVFHGVIVGKSAVTNLKKYKVVSPLKGLLLSLFSVPFYFLASVLTRKIIVLEPGLEKQLISFAGIDASKIICIPHGIDTTLQKLPEKEAREQLGIPQSNFIVGYFGFIVPYKGPHRLLQTFLATEKDLNNIKLYFLGGKSTHDHSTEYKSYYSNFRSKASSSKNILLTGFIKEDDLSNYICSCDILLFPHTAVISSSGALSMAFTFEKPVLLSNELRAYAQSPDFARALKKSGLTLDGIFLDINDPQSFIDHISLVKKNLDNYIYFSKQMKQVRNWESIARRYMQLMKPSL